MEEFEPMLIAMLSLFGCSQNVLVVCSVGCTADR